LDTFEERLHIRKTMDAFNPLITLKLSIQRALLGEVSQRLKRAKLLLTFTRQWAWIMIRLYRGGSRHVLRWLLTPFSCLSVHNSFELFNRQCAEFQIQLRDELFQLWHSPSPRRCEASRMHHLQRRDFERRRRIRAQACARRSRHWFFS